MDDDEDEREFSKSIVYGFFEQAEATFDKMVAALYVDTNFISPACYQSFSFLLSGFFMVSQLLTRH